ncbi:hypothetical protein Dtox_2670 [Desulfofarcimen acetoxidans DSM 771]|uniref:Type II secretion system protein n=1 Tax=Desulfofarcimen acetoxidans (strain ATCC 49208 / DSM 771 / KCTC 5769 / VKM B-1644 / 5575) TaxID=485916 RepID=C8W156_DESAS|nr:prepilin-type N-terminal cleavage/methylation domain-containing protein [Desulfofarcimen acetoxidans]ACV63452.1 hypothetical protein Dtox_2670 [Desulfofarcimen acetoxidans DSM 771]
MRQRIKKLLRDNGGFSLVELVVVIAIMGFLVAMIAPRILGLTDQAKATSADANAQKLESVITTHMSHAGRLLDGLTNLAQYSGTAYSALPTELNGQTVLSPDFVKNNNLVSYQLNAKEVAELKNMGIEYVYNLIDTSSTAARVAVGTNTRVLMVGAGSTTEKFDHNAGIEAGSVFNNPEYMYRIVMGIGPECEYAKVKSIDKAPVAPDVLDEDGDECVFKNYCILLPRLVSTVARINNVKPTNSITFTEVNADGTDGKPMTLDFTMPSQLGAYGTGTGLPSPYNLQQLALISPNGSKLTKDNHLIFKYKEAAGFGTVED